MNFFGTSAPHLGGAQNNTRQGVGMHRTSSYKGSSIELQSPRLNLRQLTQLGACHVISLYEVCDKREGQSDWKLPHYNLPNYIDWASTSRPIQKSEDMGVDSAIWVDTSSIDPAVPKGILENDWGDWSVWLLRANPSTIVS